MQPIRKAANIGLTHKDLKNYVSRELAREHVIELSRVMDTQIERANVEGHGSAYISLPVTFPSAGGFEPMDMQTIIYSDLLVLYGTPVNAGGKGFDKVYIDYADISNPKLIVMWQVGLSDTERASRMEIIKRHQLNQPKKLPQQHK